MCAAASFIRAQGGLDPALLFPHLWLALFGLWSWEHVPALPPEVVLLPAWVPLNIYDFACWARQTIVALSLVKAHRPVRPLPFDLDELHAPGSAADPQRARRIRRPASRRAGLLTRLDRLLRAYERHPLRPLRRLGKARAGRWVGERRAGGGGRGV